MKQLILLTILIIPILVNAQSRGPNPGEIYISTTWYYTDYEKYDMIIYSDNHGKNFTPTYIYQLGTNEMPVGDVYADLTEGVLYNVNDSGLYRTNNHGTSWRLVDIPYGMIRRYSSGTQEGEIYRYANGQLQMSADYGNTFQLINDTLYGFIEVGTVSGELYLTFVDMNPIYKAKILYSNDFGVNYEEFEVDSLIYGGGIQGNYQKMSRGTTDGELYFVSWHSPANYNIYRSTDYGNNFELQYEQPDTADFFYERYSFTAGRGDGEFYIFKKIPWFDGNNTKLHVYYSNDYAQSFTEYVHVFDKDWTGLENISGNNKIYDMYNYPNPFSDKTTIELTKDNNLKNIKIDIFNSSGQIIESINNISYYKISFIPGNISPGIYYYNLIENNVRLSTNKMVILK